MVWGRGKGWEREGGRGRNVCVAGVGGGRVAGGSVRVKSDKVASAPCSLTRRTEWLNMPRSGWRATRRHPCSGLEMRCAQASFGRTRVERPASGGGAALLRGHHLRSEEAPVLGQSGGAAVDREEAHGVVAAQGALRLRGARGFGVGGEEMRRAGRRAGVGGGGGKGQRAGENGAGAPPRGHGPKGARPG
jgi:hypothetical protein